MTTEKFYKIVQGQIARCSSVLEAKAAEYAPEDDRLAHFKASAREQGVDPKQALWGMAAKHTTSLGVMCRNHENYTASKDLWSEKITDAMNYLLLLWALVYEEEEEAQNEQH